jgi:hypothetical protein
VPVERPKGANDLFLASEQKKTPKEKLLKKGE